jgi:predicted nucleic-acid-binding protein
VTPLYIDANVIIRLATEPDTQLGRKARALFQKGRAGTHRLLVQSSVLLECVQVLESFYDIGRGDLVGALLAILAQDGVEVPDHVAIEQAFRTYALTRLDFVDCLLANLSAIGGVELASLDKRLMKLDWVHPHAW